MLNKAVQLSRFLTVITLGIILFGCNKKDPNPELRDPMSLELETRKKLAESELAAAKESLKEAEGNLAKVVPQTGQIKYATKRLNDANNRITKLEQVIKYFEIKLESQKFRARESYLTAFYDKKPWPNEEEKENFDLMVKAHEVERNWSAKNRREALGFPNGHEAPAKKPASEGHGGGEGGSGEE